MTRKEILQTAKPILFNTDMVWAILDGRKTVTRRIWKDGNEYTVPDMSFFDADKRTYAVHYYADKEHADKLSIAERTCPICPGDILYVRESWRIQAAKRYEALVRIGYRAGGRMTNIHFPYGFTDSINRDAYDAFINKRRLDRWYPSIHMPKEVARIFLRVTDVRIERLHGMTNDDAEKEGCGEYLTESKFRVSSLGHFMEIWDSTIPKKDLDKYGFDANPWVWVIQFERVEVKVDE